MWVGSPPDPPPAPRALRAPAESSTPMESALAEPETQAERHHARKAPDGIFLQPRRSRTLVHDVRVHEPGVVVFQHVEALHVHFPPSAHAVRTISEPEIETGEHRHALGVQLSDTAGRDLEHETIRPR